MLSLLEIEETRRAAGYEWICGVDEAGRGPLAGPVCAAAVILPRGLDIAGLDDSKKLSVRRRRELYDVITGAAAAYAIALVDQERIDEINILQATFRAMEEAVAKLSPQPDLALVDGNREPVLSMPCETIVGGDGKCASIAAASILAKVSRDRYMLEMAQRYPEYAFERHKGYGTKLHYERLDKYGPSPIHRKTFLRTWEGRK